MKMSFEIACNQMKALLHNKNQFFDTIKCNTYLIYSMQRVFFGMNNFFMKLMQIKLPSR